MPKPGLPSHYRRWPLILLAMAALFASACSLMTPAPTAETRQRDALDLLEAGVKQESAGDYELALQSYLQSNQLSPRPATYFHIGNCFVALGQSARALPYYEKALELSPDFDEARYALYQAQFKSDRELASLSPSGLTENVTTPEPHQNASEPAPNRVVEPKQTPPATLPDDEPTPTMSFPTHGQELAPDVEQPPIEVASNAAPPESVETPAAPVSPSPDAPRATITDSDATNSRPEETPAPEPADSSSPPPPASSPSSPTPTPEPTPPPGLGVKVLGKTLEAVSGQKKEAPLPSMEEVHGVLFGAGPIRETAVPSARYPQDRKVILGTFSYHLSKGDSLRKRNEYDKAAAEYLEALNYKPDDLECRLLLADMYKAAGRYERAETHYFRAYRQSPSNSRTLFKIGNFYLTLGKKDDAINWFEKTLALDPDYFYAHNNLGVLYMESGEAQKALTHFDAARRLDPNYANTYLNLGILYQDHLQQPEKAIESYEAYIRLAGPRTEEVKTWLDALKK